MLAVRPEEALVLDGNALLVLRVDALQARSAAVHDEAANQAPPKAGQMHGVRAAQLVLRRG